LTDFEHKCIFNRKFNKRDYNDFPLSTHSGTENHLRILIIENEYQQYPLINALHRLAQEEFVTWVPPRVFFLNGENITKAKRLIKAHIREGRKATSARIQEAAMSYRL